MIDPLNVIQQQLPPTVRIYLAILGYSSSGEHKQPDNNNITIGKRDVRISRTS